jgi:DNA-binding transcriptional MerR regulator
LSEYATTPLYNIKAVVQATGISPSTLRAWERRYNMCRPQRSESGYRLYTERDIAIIQWLKVQVDAGMSISQAVTWLETLADEADGMQNVVLPAAAGNPPIAELPGGASARRRQVRDFAALQHDLLQALLVFNEAAAEQIVAEAFAIYSVEQVGEQIFLPMLVEVGERWHRGELGVTSEHYITNYLIQRLAVLLRSLPNGNAGPLIWVGCAPTELHEVGALLLGIYLRRSGYRVHYLGQDLPGDDFGVEVQRHHPAMILFSASTVGAAEELARLTSKLTNGLSARTLIGFGGQVFNRRPELRANVAGVYMGANAQAAVTTIIELLQGKQRSSRITGANQRQADSHP